MNKYSSYYPKIKMFVLSRLESTFNPSQGVTLSINDVIELFQISESKKARRLYASNIINAMINDGELVEVVKPVFINQTRMVRLP